jgi:hypothetical protein
MYRIDAYQNYGSIPSDPEKLRKYGPIASYLKMLKCCMALCVRNARKQENSRRKSN